MPAHRIKRIRDDSHMGQQILDMGRFDKLHPTALNKGKPLARQLDFQVEGMEARAKQDRHFTQRHPFFAKLKNLLRNESRLRMFSSRFDQRRQRPIDLSRKQTLRILLGRFIDNAVREVQDRLGAAIIFFQFINRRAREQHWKVHDILERRTPERIDRLRIIPDHHHILMRRRQLTDDFGLQSIRILILIHEDIAILAGNIRACRLIQQQQLPQHHQQIVVIQQLLLSLRSLIGLLQPTEIFRMIRRNG